MKDKNIYIVIMVLLLVLCGVAWWLYVVNVGSSFSKNGNDWGYFGSYIGGVLGPILTTASILFVWFQSKKGLELQQELMDEQKLQFFIERYDQGFKMLRRAEEMEVHLTTGFSSYTYHHQPGKHYRVIKLIEDIKNIKLRAFQANGPQGKRDFSFRKIIAYHNSSSSEKELGNMEQDYKVLKFLFKDYITALSSLYFLFDNLNSFPESKLRQRDLLFDELERHIDNGKTPHLMKVFDIGYGISKHNPLVS